MARAIVWTALLAGLLAGLALSGAQQLRAVPLILAAESYEDAAPPLPATANGAQAHAHEAWKPGDGVERVAFTLLFNVLTGIAFGFLLAGGYAVVRLLRGARVTPLAGLAWGAAGYATFALAPALGLPPELPGAESAPLVARQLWWAFTAASTAGGLGLIAFARPSVAKLAGIALLVLPHLVGAPQPAEHGGAAPAELARAFVVASLASNAVFWACLGIASAWLYARFARS